MNNYIISRQPLNIILQGCYDLGRKWIQEMHYFSYSNFISHYIPSSFTIQLLTQWRVPVLQTDHVQQNFISLSKKYVIISLCFARVNAIQFSFIDIIITTINS